jgi:hypothetical protein
VPQLPHQEDPCRQRRENGTVIRYIRVIARPAGDNCHIVRYEYVAPGLPDPYMTIASNEPFEGRPGQALATVKTVRIVQEFQRAGA